MLVLLLLIVSVCAGMLLRDCRALRHLGRTSSWTVWLMIFIFGISLGSNESIVRDFARFGFSAVVISLAGVAGSVLAAWGLKNYLDKGKRQ